jgi:hypothetical protein
MRPSCAVSSFDEGALIVTSSIDPARLLAPEAERAGRYQKRLAAKALQCPRLSVGASIDLDLDQGGKLATWSQADGVGQHVCLTYMVRFTRQWLC